MWIKDLRIYQFRNLADATISFKSGVNLIIGRNGQGKTNCLESISVLSSAKSFRTNKLGELIKWGHDEASVFATLEFSSGHKNSLGLVLGNKSKKAYLNDAIVKSADEFIGLLASVTFTPDDLELVKGGPAERRRFLDKALAFLDRKSIRTLAAYNTTLKSKNALLKNSAGKSRGVLFEEMDSWNRLLAKFGTEIELSRRAVIKSLAERARIIYSSYAPDSEVLQLSLKSAKTKPEPSEYLMMEELNEAKEREFYQGQSLVGPHRDDLIITLSGKDSRSFASQGQTRSIVLALKLALIEEIEAVRGEAPIILLDDVDSELDQGRRESFFKTIVNNKRQVIISGTNAKTLPIPISEINILRMDTGIITES
jgi:DNA replication and repair protein RecF